MLSSLRIQNIAIAENVEVELDSGLNILTGETGAGKSIILKSIELLSGKKASANLIRSGADKAIIEGIFLLPQNTVKELCEHFDELSEILDIKETDQQEVLLRRIIDKSGRSKFYINGALFTQGVISNLSPHLIEITGQHDQQNLREANYHRELLDGFGTNPSILSQVKEAYSKYKSKLDYLEELKNSKEMISYKLDKLKFEQEEITKLSLKKGEKEQLEQEVEKVKHLDKIKLGLEEVVSILESQSSGSKSVYQNISKVFTIISNISKYDPELDNCLQTAQQSLTCISELSSQSSEMLRSLNFDSRGFDNLQSRLGDIKQLERKYKKDSEELISYLDSINQQIADIEGNSLDEKKIEQELSTLKLELNKLEEILTESRKKTAVKLTSEVSKDLKELNLPKARFAIEINKKASSSNGADEVVFQFSANPGEALQALEKVASGGELSRIQLILKSLSKSSNIKALQVFDEIDSGVSGAVSQSIGEKLLKLSTKSQVIAITHSAQIAALADRHLLVEKEVIKDRTYSKVSELKENRRIDSIAAMLAGKNVTEDFRKSAAKLLEIKSEKA